MMYRLRSKWHCLKRRRLARPHLRFAWGMVAAMGWGAGVVFGPVAMAAAVGRPWAERPPTVDPSFGVPKPATFAPRVPVVPFWIWAAQTRNNQIIYLRHTFRLNSVPRKVELYATADNHLEVFLNGKEITSTFHKHNQVWQRARKISVAGWLHPGKNIIAIRAKNATAWAGVLAAMMANGKAIWMTNGHWRVAYHVPAGVAWLKPQFDDAHWPHATTQVPLGGPPWGYNMHPLPAYHCNYLTHLYFQPLHISVLHDAAAFKRLSSVKAALTPGAIATIRPQYQGRSLLAPSRSIHLVVSPSTSAHRPELRISFGEEVAGRIQVRGKGGQVLIGTGEWKAEALRQPWGGVHTLNLASGKTQSTPYSAFRYATVSFKGSGPIDLNRLRLDFKYYPVHYGGAFACSDPLLTRIWYTGAYTAHLCMQEQIWDAPKRDRMMWMGDMQVSGQVINNVFLNRFLMELTMRDLREEAQGGRPASALPVDYINNIPGYSNAWFCGLADFYRHTGALGYIRSQHTLMLSMLRYIKQGFNRKNLFVNKHKKWCFVDWDYTSTSHGKLGSNTPQSYTATDLYTCLAVRRAVFLLKAIGDTVNAEKYARWDRKIIAAARKYLVNPRTHTYTNLRQVNAMAIDSHVATARQRAAIYARILGPKCASWGQRATPYYNNFVIFSLGHLGRTDQALRFVRYYWGGMLRQGATTFWEHYHPPWPPKKHVSSRVIHGVYVGNNHYADSLCHGWAAGVTSWLTEYILGVQSRTGGFAKTDMVPHLGNLAWVRGRVPTPHGNIVLRVTKTHSKESMAITLPPDVHAMIGVLGQSVTVNGTAASPFRKSGKRCYIRLIHAGSYKIVGLQ